MLSFSSFEVVEGTGLVEILQEFIRIYSNVEVRPTLGGRLS